MVKLNYGQARTQADAAGLEPRQGYVALDGQLLGVQQ